MQDSSKKIFGVQARGCSGEGLVETPAEQGCASTGAKTQERKLGGRWLYPGEKLGVLIFKISEKRL